MDWGPAAWKFLHTVTFAYPHNPSLEQQRAADAMFSSLGALLPCDRCKDHYQNEFALHPPDTRNGATLSAWLVDLHNRVNARLGKPQFSYAQAAKTYASQCTADCNKDISRSAPSSTQTTALFILLAIAAAIALAITFSRRL
jgi:hypothetical protein